jgi:redox-sensitive bicupin YhaK (pirin superfamily)
MIDLIIPARKKDLGGFEVGRVLPFPQRRMVGPFIFLDHMGPAHFAAGHGIDVRPHPHIGLATVTYLFEGEILHRDSLGSVQTIRPGEVNWMTAGRGIVHSERTDASVRAHASRVHGLQSWVALPYEAEETEPSFAHYDAASLPKFEEGGARATLIAGTAYGLASAVVTFSPMFYLHVELTAGARMELPAEHEERAAYIVSGQADANGATCESGQMAVFGSGPAAIGAVDAPVRAVLLGGANVGPRHIWWNLVSSSVERMEAAKSNWRTGRMKLPPGDDSEFIPLPEVPGSSPADAV